MIQDKYKNDFLLRKFELPYNFDRNLVKVLKNSFLQEYVYCLFIPAYKDDSFSTIRTEAQGISFHQLSRDEYERQLINIKETLPNIKMQVLFQDPLNTVKNLDYYIDLGFTSFCTCNLKQAAEIKEKDDSLETVASVTMDLYESDIKNNKDLYKELFDLIVLKHNFCRDLELLKAMPTDLKYIILVNLPCSIYCPGIQHWFIHYREGMENCALPFFCPAKVDNSWTTNTVIVPGDLPLFDNYIDLYKIEGRSATTEWILDQLYNYTQFEPNAPRPQLYQSPSNPELEARIRKGLMDVGIDKYRQLINKTSV